MLFRVAALAFFSVIMYVAAFASIGCSSNLECMVIPSIVLYFTFPLPLWAISHDASGRFLGRFGAMYFGWAIAFICLVMYSFWVNITRAQESGIQAPNPRVESDAVAHFTRTR